MTGDFNQTQASAASRSLRKETHTRSLLKAISWRCVGTIDTFLVSFLVLTLSGVAEGGAGHAAKVSGGIAAVEVVTKVLLYYLHERAWTRVKFGHSSR